MSSNPWPPEALPLQPSDPPRVDEFWLDARLLTMPSGTVFSAHDDDGQGVLVIVLSHGAASDPASWDRLAGEVNHLHSDTVIARGGAGQSTGRLSGLYRPGTGPENGGPSLAPWVALVNDGSRAAVAEARRILDAVDMSALSGTPVAGPSFRLHWIDDTAAGRVHTWPVPRPGRRECVRRHPHRLAGRYSPGTVRRAGTHQRPRPRILPGIRHQSVVRHPSKARLCA